MPAIIYSKLDAAGVNIAQQLKENYGFVEREEGRWKKDGVYLVEIDTETVTANYMDSLVETDFIIVVSKHKSLSGKPSLTAHPCGNWGKDAKVGGKPRTLAPTTALPMKVVMLNLSEKNDLDKFEVVYEATHHGPLLRTPFFYAEIGSSENEWGIKRAGELLAEAVWEACRQRLVRQKVAIGIGGVHYERKITRKVLESDVAVSHMIPKYMIGELSFEMIKQAVDKTVEDVEFALIDWKSIKSSEREKAIQILKELELPYERI